MNGANCVSYCILFYLGLMRHDLPIIFKVLYRLSSSRRLKLAGKNKTENCDFQPPLRGKQSEKGQRQKNLPKKVSVFSEFLGTPTGYSIAHNGHMRIKRSTNLRPAKTPSHLIHHKLSKHTLPNR